ncbi:phosphodiesterase [Calidifontibacter sp. DB0510]|uniref:Phosphodiesterase n=1 Tax=Metallococcus carri TaxID=1656884 RepID=A0A967B3E9_9MICO|nr:phosphodiesterase [Metallococcus carri]NHN56645.1 phosphodiesterase [Metallococcus carri]NOP38944.1 phosphodiesterase [Calidifontibacter sp. DB2511S]
MRQLGQYPAPLRTIAHLSDPHLLAGGRFLYDAVDVLDNLRRTLAQVERCGRRIDALLFTGDLADLGEDDAYERLKAAVLPVADRLGAEVIWVMGNHDERPPYARILFGENETVDEQDRVYDLGGLRVIALDTSVPGHNHGELTPGQLDWLRAELATPAELGTLLAMHHPPIPSPIELMAILELRDQDAFAGVVRGTDVRGILAGHLHYGAHSTFAGVPVSVAAASCYSLDAGAPGGLIVGVDGGQGFDLVDVYADRVVHSRIPLGSPPIVNEFTERVGEALAALEPAERLAAFSRKDSTWSPGAD